MGRKTQWENVAYCSFTPPEQLQLEKFRNWGGKTSYSNHFQLIQQSRSEGLRNQLSNYNCRRNQTMNILKQIKKTIVFAMALLCLALAFQSPSYAANLRGSWELESLGSDPVSGQITANFDHDFQGTITGSGGCNNYSAGFAANSGRIIIIPGSATLRACVDSSKNAQEMKYFQALGSATSYEVSDVNLKLTYGSDESLKYVKAQ
ncbi:MAG: META domain-containing protein [Oscillatoriales cyanobacterium]|nr:MAG: META domain-containing protein [Oscillatoriales cyanobacterium]